MKYKYKRFLSSVFAILLVFSFLCSFAFASTQSSANLNSYRAAVTPKSNGRIVLNASVVGVGYQEEIGVSTAYLYESTDGASFYRVATYESDKQSNMIAYNTTNYYKDFATYYGTAGLYYYASVYVYASDGETSDTKNYTTAIVQAIN